MIATLIMLFTSCKKEVVEENPEFIGTWRNNTTTFTFNGDGKASYSYYSSNGFSTVTKNVSGKARIKGHEIFIGGPLFKKKFTINCYPTETIEEWDTSYTYVIIAGETLIKE